MNAQRNVSTNNADFIDTLMQSADWNKISSGYIDYGESSVYIPVHYNNNITGLVFIIDSRRSIVEDGFILEIKGSSIETSAQEIINKFYSFKNTGISGSISKYNFANEFKWEMAYKDGENIFKKAIMNSSMFPGSFNINKGVKNNSITENNGSSSCTDWYLVTYYDDGSEDWDYITETCTGDCTAVKQISKGNTTTNSNGITVSCGGGSGGNGGSSSSTSSQGIVDNIKNPCLKSIVEQLKSSGLQNTVTNILQSVFNVSDKINISFDENSNLKNSQGQAVNGLTYSTPLANGGFNEDVFVNPAMLAEASKEFDASVIIHEIIHASLSVNGVATSLQHLTIAQSYIDKMKSALIGFFPSLNLEQAESMCLQGLGNGSADEPNVTAIFPQLVQHYGFNMDTNSSNNYANLAKQFQVGTRGTQCNSSSGGGTTGKP